MLLCQAKKGRRAAVIPETCSMKVNCESGSAQPPTSKSVPWTHITDLSQLFNSIDKVEVMTKVFLIPHVHRFDNKKLSYCWETVRRESMPRIAEMDVEMTT